jgi:hypothetical protein
MSRATKPLMQLDAQGRVLPDSNTDITFRCEYAAGNMIYRGQARPGALVTDPVWQIIQLNYTGSNVVSKLYPQNPSGIASSDYEFQWSARAGYTYS